MAVEATEFNTPPNLDPHGYWQLFPSVWGF
jgi:hypothetical protein